nr:nitrate- and nitrite sensing domain-containing protein [Streptomyces polyasparticus]
MQSKRPGEARPGQSEQPGEAGRGRTVRVRSRLIAAVAVVTAAVVGAGAPAVLGASSQVADTQSLVDLAELTQRTVTLAHALSDERDEVTSYIAAGRPEDKQPGPGTRVDRQLAELRAEAPPSLREDLAAFTSVRREARSGEGEGSALEVHTAYTQALTELHRLTEELADQLPARAGKGRHALADLDRAVAQAGEVRGLLLAAYATPRTAPQTVIDPLTGLPVTAQAARTPDDRRRDALTTAAYEARLGERAALDAFAAGAPVDQRAKLRTTVTGPDVATADRYIARLTDRPTLNTEELGYNSEKIATSLTARVDQLRSVENSLVTERIRDLNKLRDDDVTALELRIALVGVLALLALGVGIAVARTLTQPLAALRLGTARLAGGPGSEEPVRYTGRNDEFAAVVRSVNALYEHTVKLHARVGVLEEDRKHFVGEREQLACERVGLRKELAAARDELQRVEDSVQSTFVNLALRTLGLVERQLAVIEGLEEREEDPERLATLFKLDHFATVMRRHSENLLVLAGAEHKHAHPGPVPLVDVVRAAVSEIERYERVRIAALPPHAHLAGFAADDLSHLLAELLENATSFSPPDAAVEVSGWLLESGEVMLSVQDEGIGLTPERLHTVNSRLAEFDPDALHGGDEGLGLGLYVVGRLAARHGVRVELREQKHGGITAVAVLPKPILAAAPAAAVTPGVSLAGAAPELHLAGAEAEANSNELAGRSRLVAAAEAAVAAAERDAAAVGSGRDAGAESPERAPEGEGSELASGTEGFEEGFEPAPGAESFELAPDAESFETAPAVSDADDVVRAAEDDSVRAAEDDPVREADPVAAEPGDSGGEPVFDGEDLVAAAFGEREPRHTEQALDDPLGPEGPDDLAETGPETTLELALPAPELDTPHLLRPTRIEAVPDDHAHERTEDETPRAEQDREQERERQQEREQAQEPVAEAAPAPRAPKWERVTDKGLPKRTPKVTTPAAQTAPARPKGVDAEALRRRLAGFRQGAETGRRDVEAELADVQPESDGRPERGVQPESDGRPERGVQPKPEVPHQTEAEPRHAAPPEHSAPQNPAPQNPAPQTDPQQETTEPGDSLKEARS